MPRTLEALLEQYPVEVQELARSARRMILETLPDVEEEVDVGVHEAGDDVLAVGVDGVGVGGAEVVAASDGSCASMPAPQVPLRSSTSKGWLTGAPPPGPLSVRYRPTAAQFPAEPHETAARDGNGRPSPAGSLTTDECQVRPR